MKLRKRRNSEYSSDGSDGEETRLAQSTISTQKRRKRAASTSSGRNIVESDSDTVSGSGSGLEASARPNAEKKKKKKTRFSKQDISSSSPPSSPPNSSTIRARKQRKDATSPPSSPPPSPERRRRTRTNSLAEPTPAFSSLSSKLSSDAASKRSLHKSSSSSSSTSSKSKSSKSKSSKSKSSKTKSSKSKSSKAAAAKKAKAPTNINAKPRYKYMNRVKEEHDLPIYSVQFNYMDKRHRDMFATVGTNRVTVYRVDRESSDIQVLQAYHDSESQDLYTCAWTYNDENGHPMLLIGGDSARIKVLDITTRKVVKTLFGHGGAINELRVYPKDPNILLSASKDESVRLWNIKTKTCIAIFTGDEGHRDDVLSADFNLDGTKIVSSGMDHSIRVWEIDEEFKRQIKRSYHVSDPPSPFDPPFKVKTVQFPHFMTRKVHDNYVDCVRFLGDYILSKSVGPTIALWKAAIDCGKQRVNLLQEYKFVDCDIWYVRFSMDFKQRLLACGNKSGSVFVWNVDDVPCSYTKLSVVASRRAVRQVAFNYDGSVLLSVCEDGTIWRWDQIKRKSDK